jgi:tripartite motif-containing protein 71
MFGSSGSGNGQFKTPEGIAVDAHNNVWASDTYNGRLEEFNEKGEYATELGTEGSGNGQFKHP